MGADTHPIGRRLLLSAILAGLATAAGCAAPTSDAVAPARADLAVGPVAEATPTLAALVESPDQPFNRPVRSVNVFGEVDGVGPGAFNVAGKVGFVQRTFVEEGYDADPSLSPDGKWIVFSSTRHSEHAGLYLQRVDGLAVTQLSDDGADDAFPTFSPDGQRIAFASNRGGNWDLYVMGVDGTNVEAVTGSPAEEIHPSFSPDGKRLVYSALGSRSGQWELWTIDLATKQRRMIGYGLLPSWCPRTDRDVIAFQRARQRGTRWFSAWTLELIDGEAKHVTEVAMSANAAIVAPTWSRDGRRLAFCSITDPNTAQEGKTGTGIATKGGQTDVWIVNLDGSGRRRLTDGRGVNATPCWSGDDSIYFVSDRGGSEAIWSLDAGGKKGGAVAAWPTYPDDAPPKVAGKSASPADDAFGPGATASVDSGHP